MYSDLVPQRWGVGSTRLHLEVESLALGVLLFDRIVLPTPSDVAEADRWDELGWNTETHARRIVQLGELVHFAPWDDRLRADWRARWDHITAIGAATRNLAYMMTPQVIAQSAWGDVVGFAESTGLHPKARPVPVVWHHDQAPSEANAQAAMPIGVGAALTAPYEEVSALQFRRVLEQPVRDDPVGTLDAALRLANDPEFQEARRALYTAEALAAVQGMEPGDFSAHIDAAVRRHNDIVAAHERARVRRVIHHVVPAVVGASSQLAQVPGMGAAGQWSARKVLARLLPLPPAPAAAEHEGSAIGQAQRTMAAVISGSGPVARTVATPGPR